MFCFRWRATSLATSEPEVHDQFNLPRVIERLSAGIVAAGIVDRQLVGPPRISRICRCVQELTHLRSGTCNRRYNRRPESGVDVGSELGVVEEIGRLRGEAQFIVLAKFEVFLERHVYVPSRGAAQAVITRLRISIPKVIGEHSPTCGGYGAPGKGIHV